MKMLLTKRFDNMSKNKQNVKSVSSIYIFWYNSFENTRKSIAISMGQDCPKMDLV